MVDVEGPTAMSLLDETTATGGGRRPAAQLPEPARFWIRYVPRPRPLERHWPAPSTPWLDLSRGRLFGLETVKDESSPGEPPPLPALATDPLDDVLYLPPVAVSRAAERDVLASRHAVRGTPVLMQVTAGESVDLDVAPGVHPVVDLTSVLLTGRVDLLDRVPAGSTVAWPLVSGITDDPAALAAGCARLSATGVGAVQGVVPQLTPADKRRLMEHFGDELFDALFHRDPPQVRNLARVAHAHGLAPFMERPLPRRPMLGIGNRRLAGWITLAAELEDRLGRSPQRVQGLYRAAREADRTPYDLEALARDGNLGVLDWLSAEARRIVDEALEEDPPSRIQRLLEEYVQ